MTKIQTFTTAVVAALLSTTAAKRHNATTDLPKTIKLQTKLQPGANAELSGLHSGNKVALEPMDLSKLTSFEKRSEEYTCARVFSSPLYDDCSNIISYVEGINQEFNVGPGYCLEGSYGTCLIYFCAVCEDMDVPSGIWGSYLGFLNGQCVQNGQTGYLWEDDHGWELGIEHTGDELPRYPGQC